MCVQRDVCMYCVNEWVNKKKMYVCVKRIKASKKAAVISWLKNKQR